MCFMSYHQCSLVGTEVFYQFTDTFENKDKNYALPDKVVSLILLEISIYFTNNIICSKLANKTKQRSDLTEILISKGSFHRYFLLSRIYRFWKHFSNASFFFFSRKVWMMWTKICYKFVDVTQWCFILSYLYTWARNKI